jgi:hypothetical protein
MSIDLYSTKAQLKALEVMPREYTFLYDMFAADMGAVEDDTAIYDYKKNSRRMAPFVVPGTGGVLMGRDGYETREIGFCRIAPERIVDEPLIKVRGFGEAILGAKTPEQRAMQTYAKDMTEMRQAIQRRREWMARQVLLTGKLEIFRYTENGRDKETTLVADYGFTNNYTPVTAWDQPGAKIAYDMRKLYDIVYNGMGVVDLIVMDPDSAEAMVENSAFMKTFDYKNAEMGQIRTRYRGQGVRYWGQNSDGVDLYSFGGSYVDDDGVTKPIMPKGTVLIGGHGIIKCPHGPVTQVEEYGPNGRHKTYIKKEVPFRNADPNTNTVSNRLTSCPTMVPFNVDAWAIGHVL